MAEIIGSAAIEIKAKDKNFENEVRKIAGKIKKVEVPVDAVVNTDLAKKQLEAFRKSQQGRKVKLYAEVDTRSAATTLNKFIKSYQSKNVKLSVDVDTESVLEAATLLDDFKEQYHDKTIDVAVDVDKSLGDDLDSIRNSASNLENALNKDLRLNVNSAGANAQLLTTAALAQATRRAITSPMRMNIDKQTLDGIKGFFYTLTGGIPIDKVRTALTGLAANFEGISVKSGIVSSSVLSLAGTLSHAVGDLLTIGGDVTQVVGLLNAAPAGLAAGGLALTGTILGWKGFGQALMGEGKEAAEAMKLLPPEAQKAVKALDGVGSSIRRTTQARYWKGMGTAVQDVMGAIRKDLDVGMGNAGEALGGQMSAIFGAMQEFGESGGLSNTFRDLNEFFKTSTPALAGLTSGFLDLMEGGAREMPAFGSWLSKLGTGFSNWAKEANETGTINIWIQEASQRMKELGKVTQATYGMFSGLTTAARNAGMNGLTELASGMVDVSNAMNEPAFQKGMTSFFSSVRVGAANALPGVGNFFEMMGEGLPTINKAMEISGTVTGNMFDNFARMFENGNMGRGFLSMLGGMKDATATLAPGFESLGNALGGLMEVSGEVLRNVAPGLNQLFETVDVVVNNMKDGIIDAMPVFNEFIQGLLAGIRSVVGPLASLAGGMLSAFSNLPGPIQTALMSIGGFLGATALIKNKMKDANSSVGAFASGTQNRMRNMASGVANSVAVMNRAYGSFDPSKSRALIGPQTLAQANSNMQKLVNANRITADRIQGIWAVADVKREQIDQRAQARQAANKFQAQRVNQTGIGGQILPITGRNGFDSIAASARTASAKAANSLGTIGKTAGVVGGQITRGIGAAIGGLTGALGGPWGLAITAGVAGMAAIGKASAEQKQKVEDLYQTLDNTGNATSQTAQSLANSIYTDKGTFWDKLDGVMQGDGWNDTKVSGILDEVGLKAGDVAVNMTTMGDKYTDAWKRIEKASNNGLRDGANALKLGLISKEDLDTVGISVEHIEKLNGTKLNAISDSIVGFSGHLDEAEIKAAALRQSIKDVASAQVGDNADILGSQITSAEEKLAAFKSNLTLLGREQLTGQESFYKLGQVTEQNSSQLKELRTNMASAGKSIRESFDISQVGGQNIAMFKMNTQAGRQMYDIMRSQADGIQTAVVGSYDTVLKETNNLADARAKAMQTAKREVEAFKSQLADAGLSPEAIDSLIDTSGLSLDDIEVAITTSGADEAIQQALAVEGVLRGLDSGDWKVSITAITDQARSGISEITGLAENFTTKEFEASMRAKFDNEGQYQAWMQEFSIAIPARQIEMVAELNGAEEARSKIDGLYSKGGELDGKTWNAAIQVAASEAETSTANVFEAINSIPKDTLASITAKVKGDPEAELDAILGSKEFEAAITAAIKNDPKAEVESAMGSGVVIDVKPEVTETPNLKSMLGLGPIVETFPIQAKVEPPTSLPEITVPDVTVNTTANPDGANQVKTIVDSITDKSVEVSVQANESNLNSIRDTMNSLSDKSISVNVQANESNLNSIRDTMNSLSDKSVSVSVNASESGLGHIKSLIDGLTGKVVSVSVNASESGLGHIKSLMDSVKSKAVSVTVSVTAGPVQAVKTAMDGITSKVVGVIVMANPAPALALKMIIDGINSKIVSILALAPIGAVVALRDAIASVNSKVVAVMAITNTNAVLGLVNAIGAVRSKTVTVTAITRSIGENANGGVYMGGVRTFARGGFDDPRIAKAIERAQRRSGPENHQAQIARGSNNYRVWGEPETGGEAYIPLAMAKRSRSLKILEQVASHFGVSLSQYVDGGLISGNKVSSNVTTFASGGTTKATKTSAKAKEAEKKRQSDLKELNKTIKESISDLKKALSSGLTDLKSAFGKADRSPVQKALDGVRKGVRDFRSETTKQIKEAKKLGKSTKTMSAQLKASSKVDKAVTKQMYSSNVWNRKGSNLQDSQYIANDAQRRQRDRRVDYNSKFTLRDYELAINNINKELEKQQDKYDEMVKNHTSNMESISGNLFKQFDLGSLVNSKDEFGYRPPTTARDISSYAKKMLTDMKKFSSNLKALRKAGYNEAIINQISQMGLEEALVVSQALLSDKSQLKSINSSFTQMFGKNGDMNIASDGSTYVGGLARSIGKSTANAMFKAGVDIQKGLVDGLTADVKALEKAGQTMSDALTKSFRKSLKIQSPSKVFRDLAKFIPQGIVQGIDSGQGSVDSSISGLVQPRKLNLTAPGSRTTNSSGIINGNGGTNPVTVNVYPSEGMSERQIGTTAAREIHYRLDAGL